MASARANHAGLQRAEHVVDQNGPDATDQPELAVAFAEPAADHLAMRPTRSATITWSTGNKGGGRLTVSRDGEGERDIARESSGSTTVDWIAAASHYAFRLYAGDDADPIREVTLQPAVDQVCPRDEPPAAAARLTSRLQRLVTGPDYRAAFQAWEAAGVHVTRTGFYSPVPTVAEIPEQSWHAPLSLPHVDFRPAEQLRLLREVFPTYREEYATFPRSRPKDPSRFFFDNNQFGGTDALALYCMLRHLRPQLVIEVGSGYSTRMMVEAARRNGETRILCIEPYPDEPVRHDLFKTAQAHLGLVPARVEDLDPDVFSLLGPGDVLFIDSSHVSKIGSDVNHLFFNVIPNLQPGVVVHVHDVFFPNDYPKQWVTEYLRFWNEQYLLAAFLSFNDAFEVLLANSYLEHHHPGDLRTTFPDSPWWGGGSFWMRRKMR